MVRQPVHGAQADVGEGAEGERDAVADQAFDQRRVLHAAQAVVDAFHAEDVEGLGDVLRRALLPRVRHPAQAERGGGLVDLAELRGRIVDLGGVESDAGDAVQVGLGLVQGAQGRLGGLVAQEAEDQPGGDPVVPGAAAQRPPQPLDDRAHLHAARGVGLRVEEDLRVPHALGGGPGEVGVGEVGEVPLGPQNGHQLVVQVQKGLQVLEPVRLAEGVRVGVRQGHAVARGELEHELRFQGAFDMQVQFGFGEGHQSILRLFHTRFGTGTRWRSRATVSSPVKPAARACRSNSAGSG